MNDIQRRCPSCQTALSDVWLYGHIEMGRCPHCGEIPLATVYLAAPEVVEYETEFKATAVNDYTFDFYLRLSRLVPEYNVVQLKKMEIVEENRRIVPLGIRTNTIDLHCFMTRVQDLRLSIEIQPVIEE